MNMQELVPKDKFDIERAEELFQYSFDEIEPVIRQILEWLQDGNWPVSRPVSKYILSLPPDKIEPYLMEIMNGTDYEWKYFLICIFDKKCFENGYPSLLKELERLISNPTETEIGCEVHWMAKVVLKQGDY